MDNNQLNVVDKYIQIIFVIMHHYFACILHTNYCLHWHKYQQQHYILLLMPSLDMVFQIKGNMSIWFLSSQVLIGIVTAYLLSVLIK
ncbi:hypothetical protein BDF19DRAFT_433762 [Syncephalis fuscata]|nr:hypothetical protein BDF19DRAFT_433762 [Syncephalis fuscata]